jgi:hypothetical protein
LAFSAAASRSFRDSFPAFFAAAGGCALGEGSFVLFRFMALSGSLILKFQPLSSSANRYNVAAAREEA